MHTVELLEEAICVARKLGYGIRHEWLGGVHGGACEVAGKKWLFVDLSLNIIDQFDQVLQTLRSEPQTYTLKFSPGLREAIEVRQAA